MAVKIVTEKEAERMQIAAKKYNESCVVLCGNARGNYICDNSGTPITLGSKCCAIALHPNTKHHNYQSDVDRLADYVDVSTAEGVTAHYASTDTRVRVWGVASLDKPNVILETSEDLFELTTKWGNEYVYKKVIDQKI